MPLINMKSLHIAIQLFIALLCQVLNGKSSVIIEVKEDIENLPILNLNQEPANVQTVCARFNYRGKLKNRILMSTSDYKFVFALKFDLFSGYFLLNGKTLIYNIKKKSIHPYSWYHVCLSWNSKTYRIVGNGQIWYNGEVELKNMTVGLKKLSIGGYHKQRYATFEAINFQNLK